MKVLAIAIAATLFATGTSAQGLPHIARAEVPQYPSLALTAGIAGTVRIEVTLKDGRIAELTVRSPGVSPLLVAATTANIRTWEFVDAADTVFAATFIYELSRRRAKGAVNPEVIMRLPNYVRVRGMRPRPTVLKNTLPSPH